jgi:hypothetical protein
MDDDEKRNVQQEIREMLVKLDSPKARARVEKLTRANIERAERVDARILARSKQFANRIVYR